MLFIFFFELHSAGIIQQGAEIYYTLHGHQLRLFTMWEAQYVTAGIIYLGLSQLRKSD
jgi:hypothetical protein